MISLSDFLVILGFLGALTGVWARGEIRVATLAERVRGNEEKRKEDKLTLEHSHSKLENIIEKIFEKLSDIDEKINQKADR